MSIGDGSFDPVSTAARNLAITATLADVVRRCRGAGLRVLPLKGGALLASTIVAPHERHLDDLDVWLEPAGARAAYDLLVDAGYRASATSTHLGVSSLDAPTHQLPILRSPFGAVVEIHLESHGRGDAGDFEACYAAGVDVVVLGVLVRVPCTLHLLEQICGHVVVHHVAEQRYWPRHVEDVRRLIARDPGLAALRDRRDEVGLSVRVAHGLELDGGIDAWLARVFVHPGATTAQLLRFSAVGARSLRFLLDAPTDFFRVIVPTASHLRSSGDLRNDGVARAHLRRWRRILGRL